MKVFKFGGASVKDAEGVKNLLAVLESTQEKELVVVASAMDKTTNALEQVVYNYLNQPSEVTASINEVAHFHLQLAKGLFTSTSHPIFTTIHSLFKEVTQFLQSNKSTDHSFVYDQVVSYGELASTHIISAYLQERGCNNNFLDVRECILTDDSHRDAKVDWEATQQQIINIVQPKAITITQGFLGAETTHNFTTTLGREGSDYSAAIFAYCLNADSVTIWKDVPGVLNADPRHFDQTTLLHHISYREAIELSFYGASVIHPKTLQPLQRKEIPLYVKSFLQPQKEGTHVGKGVQLDPMVSCFILKKNLVLISLSSLDFSFIMEDHISDVFKWLHLHRMKVELIQNSAISFSVCIDNRFNNLKPLLQKLREKFKVRWNENVTLYTIRHAIPKEIKAMEKGKTILVKQQSRETVQLVVRQ